MMKRHGLFAGAAALALGWAGAQAQESSPYRPLPDAEPAAAEDGESAAPAPERKVVLPEEIIGGPPPEIASGAEPAPVSETAPASGMAQTQAADAEPEVNPDEMADMLNRQQTLKQSYTFTRKLNGEIVETDTRTVTFTRDDPLRQTEAGIAPHEALRAAFDSELLTRTEAEEEAEFDFTVADRDRDNMMTASEFVGLVESWRLENRRAAGLSDDERQRQAQYARFVDGDDPMTDNVETEAQALRKFAYMAGPAGVISRDEYTREYLLDFDSMDANNDALLKGDELMMFRALNRGETLATPALDAATAQPVE